MNLERYFDYNATTPVDHRVMQDMEEWFCREFANPSAFYGAAVAARSAVEEARSRVAALIGARPDEIIFTMGGTESDNLAIAGSIKTPDSAASPHIITSAVEHPAVLNACRALENRGVRLTVLPVDAEGRVDPDDLRKAISPATVLVSIMYANNEIGTIQPIRELAAVAREAGVLFHTDAIQTTGRIPMDVKELGVDLLSLSAHKMYGPKGIGAMYRRKGLRLTPLVWGGGHESGLRSGTENVPGIVGLGRAAQIARQEMDELAARITPIRDRLHRGLFERIPELLLNGSLTHGLYNTLNVSVRHIEGEAILAFLDGEGFALASGSACSSKSLEPSPVLTAIGRSHADAHGSLRFSLGRHSSEAGVDALLDALPPVVARLRSMSPFGKSGGPGNKQ